MNNKYKIQVKEFLPSIQQIATSDAANSKNGSQMQIKSNSGLLALSIISCLLIAFYF